MVKPTRVTNNIRTLRFANGEMTQAELADRVGVTRQTVIAIEQGRYSPSLEMAFQIARVFGVPLDEVFHYPKGSHESSFREEVSDRCRVLYIAATVAGVLSKVVGGSMIEGPGITGSLAANETAVVAVAFLLLVMAVTGPGVAFMMYPILMQDAKTKAKEGFAAWYLGSRVVECAVFVVALLGLFSLLALSKEFAGAGASAASSLQPLGTALWTGFDYAWMLGQSVFCVGAVMFYYLLYVSKRVPRWLSVWGLIAAPLMLIAGFSLVVTGDPSSTFSSILYAPIGLQEMVLAVWLIARGSTRPPRTGRGGPMTAEQTVLVVGGTGRTGGRVLQQLLGRGVDVRAIVRSAERLPAGVANNPHLTVIEADLLSLGDEDLQRSVRGCDAVISCLGHVLNLKGILGPPRDLVTQATKMALWGDRGESSRRAGEVHPHEQRVGESAEGTSTRAEGRSREHVSRRFVVWSRLQETTSVRRTSSAARSGRTTRPFSGRWSVRTRCWRATSRSTRCMRRLSAVSSSRAAPTWRTLRTACASWPRSDAWDDWKGKLPVVVYACVSRS